MKPWKSINSLPVGFISYISLKPVQCRHKIPTFAHLPRLLYSSNRQVPNTTSQTLEIETMDLGVSIDLISQIRAGREMGPMNSSYQDVQVRQN